MDALKQSILERSNLREEYLRGDVTLAEAKRGLRIQAQDRGIVGPLRPRPGQIVAQYDLNSQFATHMANTLAGSRHFRLATVRRAVLGATDREKRMTLKMSGDEIRNRAADRRFVRRIVLPDDESIEINPWWYR
jgi:hypothetical protein